MIDSVPLPLLGQYSMNGVSVQRYCNRVRISVPNCQDLTLVMWVICENQMLEDPDDPGVTLIGDMIKFVVMRGLNFGHRQAHGLLGENSFPWNYCHAVSVVVMGCFNGVCAKSSRLIRFVGFAWTRKQPTVLLV